MQLMLRYFYFKVINCMLKVIFRVEKLALKLRNIECQILAKKNSSAIPLSPRVTIKDGQALIGVQTEFLIIQNDPIFLIQVSLIFGGSKKLGGEMQLNVADWDQNIHHSTIANLKKSPDANAHIYYTFLFIRKNDLTAYRPLVLYSEYRDKNLVEIEGIKKQLTMRHDCLQDQVNKLKQENKTLQKNEKMKIEEMNYKKCDHDQKIKTYQQSFEKNNLKNCYLKRENQQIMDMINKYGKDQTRQQLEKKYPHIFQNNENSKISNKKKQMFDEKIQSNSKNINNYSPNGGTFLPQQSPEANQRQNKQDRQRSRQRRPHVKAKASKR